LKKLKVLVVSSFNNPDKAMHAVDIWRAGFNIKLLKKNVDWDITERPTIMKHIAKYKDEKDFTEAELKKTVEDLAQFDIVYGSYTCFMHNMVFSLCKMVEAKYGTKFVLDVDDNLFAVKQDNIGWWLYMDHDKTWDLQTVILNTTYITTTNEYLANELRKRRKFPPENVIVVPNYISKDYKNIPDGHEGIRIGYFGGSSHYKDLHATGVIDAIRQIMIENKQVRFMSTGMPVEAYLPRKRYTYSDGCRGKEWIYELYPTLNYDISIAPLTVDEFAVCKSDIKWQESTRMGAATVATDVRPYAETIRDGVDGLLVKNGQKSWYKALKKLVDDEAYRKELASNAYKRVEDEFLIENNWIKTKQALEAIGSMK
jgi:glycosyltransferase involved in cell wall biosynthesis